MSYRREKGRIRSSEKRFNFEYGGDPDPKYAVPCTHGWYRTDRNAEFCVKCRKPRADCEADVAAMEADRKTKIAEAQEGE